MSSWRLEGWKRIASSRSQPPGFMPGADRIMPRIMELLSSAMYFHASTLRPRPVVLDICSHSVGGVYGVR